MDPGDQGRLLLVRSVVLSVRWVPRLRGVVGGAPAGPLKGTGREGSGRRGSGQEVAFCALGLRPHLAEPGVPSAGRQTQRFCVRPGRRRAGRGLQRGRGGPRCRTSQAAPELRLGGAAVRCVSRADLSGNEGRGPGGKMVPELLPHHEGVHRASSLQGSRVVPGTGFSICLSGEQSKFPTNRL